MNATDYLPLAREYLIWNATVAALQFWTADREACVLCSAIEQVYNAFFYTTSTNLLCQQSEEVLFGHFMTMLNATFKANLHWKRRDMRVEAKISTYPLLSDVTPESTMFPVKTTPTLTLPLHAAQVPASHIASLYIANYHSIDLKKKVQQLTLFLLTALHHHRTSWILHSSQIPSPSIPFVMT